MKDMLKNLNKLKLTTYWNSIEELSKQIHINKESRKTKTEIKNASCFEYFSVKKLHAIIKKGQCGWVS